MYKKYCLVVLFIICVSNIHAQYSPDSTANTNFVISADYMNVMYLGINNPIMIGNSSETFEHTTIKVKNATMMGEGSQRWVTPKKTGKVVIIVKNKGEKPVQFEFEVKRIPDPVIFVGSSKGSRMSTSVFKAQQGIRAVLENFVFEGINFKVTNYTVVFSGSAFTDPVTRTVAGNTFEPIIDLINQCKPGTTVTFNNIEIESPGGEKRKLYHSSIFNLY